MQKRSVRFVAVFAVLAMVVAPLAAATIESSDSDADAIVDYTRYYYDQLGEQNAVVGQWLYDSVVSADGTTLTFTEEFETADDLHLTVFDKDSVVKKVGDDLQKGLWALSIEQPRASYWLKLKADPDIEKTYISTTGSASNITKVEVKYTFQAADYDTFGTKATADPKIESKLSEISSSLDKTSRETTIKGIHDELCNMLTYDKGEEGKSNEVRSVYTALVGTGHVVCEGYAKAFKSLCDYNSIPCLILTGEAGTDGTYENHMWNYVMMENECWYLVDCTWDDQMTTVYDYYLAGSNTVGFNDTKVGVSHDPKKGDASTVTGYGFTVPSMAFISATDPSFVVTFMSEGEVHDRIAVPKNEKMTHIASNPTIGGKEFVRWCTDAEFTTPWDWNNATVTSDMTLYAQFTADPVSITLKNGDQDGSITVIKNTSIQLTELINLEDPDKKFLGWNTSSDGKGMYYSSNDIVSLKDPITLYAIWEVPSNDAFSKAMTQLNEFLAGDSVINGVSNTVLAIAVCSGVLLLIGFLLIRMKK